MRRCGGCGRRRVRAGPDHRAVIMDRVVGYAMPAERPPTTLAANSTVVFGAYAATMHAGIDRIIP